MRKLVMMLAVMALLTAFPAAAGAEKPQPPGQEPFPGLTCQKWFEDEDHDDALWLIDDETDDFSLTLTPGTRAACVDVMTFDSGQWLIELNTVKVASLQMQIKDSVPGDFCFREGWEEKKNTIPDSPWVIDVWTPAATIDGCTPGEIGLAADQDPTLVFMVSYTPERKSDGSGVIIKVNLP